jgi:hypothetical protein
VRFIENNDSLDTVSNSVLVNIESCILKKYYPLNLNDTLDQRLLQNYNQKKFRLNCKASKSIQNTVKDDTIKLMLLMDKQKDLEFFPRFNNLVFIQQWRARKEIADQEQLIGLGDRNKIKLNPQGGHLRRVLAYNVNRRIVRTLRFERAAGGEKIYTILNVYECNDGLYEAVLRWGKIEGTAVGGGTLKYPLGDKTAMLYYISHLRGFYGLMHEFKSDSA